MPSPIGNWQSPDEGDDPDLWPEWYDDGESDASSPRRRGVSPWLAVVALVLVAAMVVGAFL